MNFHRASLNPSTGSKLHHLYLSSLISQGASGAGKAIKFYAVIAAWLGNANNAQVRISTAKLHGWETGIGERAW